MSEPMPAQADTAPATEGTLRERVEAVLRTIYDPEIPVNICELGLVYELNLSDDGVVDIKMTLTAPNCPAAGAMPAEIEAKVRAVDGVTDARDRKSTRLNSSHIQKSRMPSSA